MKLAGILLSYALAVGVLFSTLAGGVMWLIQPGPAVSQEARPAPLPPRIADSIARRQPFPVEEPTPESVKPAMQEAKVSLAPAPVYSARIRELSVPVKQTRKRRSEQAVAREAPAVSASSPAATISAARSDFPY
jgi:hypothetical protein